jgi:thiol-disulfide isomerase/thioredoxin
VNLFENFPGGLPYAEFLHRYATPGQMQRWQRIFDEVKLTVAQRALLASFTRPMSVLCLAGAWCGDCSSQCPIFEHIAAAAPSIRMRYLDRDEHADAQRELQINGGNRIPVVVFFSEDGYEVGRYGERTLSKYRRMMQEQAGRACPSGLSSKGESLLADVTQDWLNEFERVQWMLRLSPRLREVHGD